jgi:hypothetical protein
VALRYDASLKLDFPWYARKAYDTAGRGQAEGIPRKRPRAGSTATA